MCLWEAGAWSHCATDTTVTFPLGAGQGSELQLTQPSPPVLMRKMKPCSKPRVVCSQILEQPPVLQRS